MDAICGYYTFIHHRGPLVEWSDNITERHAVIDKDKPEHERATRHRCIVRVPEERLPHLYAARTAYEAVEGPARTAYAAPRATRASWTATSIRRTAARQTRSPIP